MFPYVGACDFEKGLCTWTNARGIDQFDWIIGSGDSGSSFMGPAHDHTQLEGDGG